MSTKRKNRQEYDDEDETNIFKSHKGKHPKHSNNMKGKGMRVINRYVEEDYDDDEDDFFMEDESHQDRNYKTRFYISTTR
jgi:hypothetical protein